MYIIYCIIYTVYYILYLKCKFYTTTSFVTTSNEDAIQATQKNQFFHRMSNKLCKFSDTFKIKVNPH